MEIERLLTAIGQLPPTEFVRVYDYVHQHPRAASVWGIVPPENLRAIREIMRPVQEDAAAMTDEEVAELIDRALAEVRRERQTKSGD